MSALNVLIGLAIIVAVATVITLIEWHFGEMD